MNLDVLKTFGCDVFMISWRSLEKAFNFFSHSKKGGTIFLDLLKIKGGWKNIFPKWWWKAWSQVNHHPMAPHTPPFSDPTKRRINWRSCITCFDERNLQVQEIGRRDFKMTASHISSSGWWLNQPIWKILVQLDHHLQVGVKIKNIWVATT